MHRHDVCSGCGSVMSVGDVIGADTPGEGRGRGLNELSPAASI